VTFAGPPAAVADAAFRAVEKAASLIDLTRHQGAHPRIGAADVVPFIPIEGVTLEDCVELAEGVGREIWRRLKIPVYFYEAAARRPERVNLENIRRGQFEALLKEMGTVPERHPDVGDPVCHPTAGAVVVGARKFLIAYNINLGTADAGIAKKIAKIIRFSSGGFRYVKAMGVALASRNQSQVSMNLTDFEQTPMHLVFEAVRRQAERHGVAVVGSEIVGLIPRKALEMSAGYFLRCENFRPELVLENRIADAMAPRGGLPEFLDALAAATVTPGGGGAPAAAAAMSAALGAKVTRLAKLDSGAFEEDRRFFTGAAERAAAGISMEVLERASALLTRLAELKTPTSFASDVAVAKALAAAARTGAAEYVRLNLDAITDQDLRASLEARLHALNFGE
jgi:glutamate formiminotransferase